MLINIVLTIYEFFSKPIKLWCAAIGSTTFGTVVATVTTADLITKILQWSAWGFGSIASIVIIVNGIRNKRKDN